MKAANGEGGWFMATLSPEQYLALEPEDQILAILDDHWAQLPEEQRDARWQDAAAAADRHVLLARSRRARRR